MTRLIVANFENDDTEQEWSDTVWHPLNRVRMKVTCSLYIWLECVLGLGSILVHTVPFTSSLSSVQDGTPYTGSEFANTKKSPTPFPWACQSGVIWVKVARECPVVPSEDPHLRNVIRGKRGGTGSQQKTMASWPSLPELNASKYLSFTKIFHLLT